MRVEYEKNTSETLAFAAEELAAYLKKMLSKSDDLEIELQLEAGEEEDLNDRFSVQMTPQGGRIIGNNGRSVLLGVYDYLHVLGCRFLLPGKKGERIPRICREEMAAVYEKQASFRHRGVCIEGADSAENVLDFIDWLPKVGYNSFFLQFQVPYAFLARWYHHEEHPNRSPEVFTWEDAKCCMKEMEAELKKRGLLLHAVGHGWTGEALGYRTASWTPTQENVTPQTGKFAAMLGGERKLFKGIPADTNLCYQQKEAVNAFAEAVVAYAEEYPQVDYLHIWLADEYNNVCECEKCRGTTISDQYVKILNEIDRRLTEKQLQTRLVFLLYQELLWPPIKERLQHPERFVLMFAPISRTFAKSYLLEDIPEELPAYVRNQIVLPSGLGENLAYLKKWQEQFQGDSFIYDYPLGRAHYGDFGYLHMAKIISADIKKLKSIGLDGYISCQELRACLPNALPNYLMGYTLFDEKTDPETLIREYFEAAYENLALEVRSYLQQLSELQCCDYLNGKGERADERIVRNMEQIRKCCEEFRQDYLTGQRQNENLFWELLAYHEGYVQRLAEALRLLASGRKEEACKAWRAFREYIGEGEETFQPYLDMYRVLEVTQKYTGF